MAIITLARERGAYGRVVATQLAERLGAHFIDREIIDSRLEKMGIKESRRTAFDERKPGFFAALSSAVEEYTCCLKQVMYEEAKGGNCVILGRGAQTLFKDVPGVVTARLIGTPEVRYQRVSEQEHISVRQAKEIVDRTDQDRAGFNSYFFDADWSGANGYQLVLNTDQLTPEQAVEMILKLAEISVTPGDLERADVCLENLARAQAIERELLFVKRIQVFFLRVLCDGPHVTLRGVAHSAEAIEQAKAAAAAFEGVSDVDCKIEIGVHGHFGAIRG